MKFLRRSDAFEVAPGVLSKHVMDRSFRRSAGLALLKAACFEKTFVQASLRQKSRHTLFGRDFATIIVEHGKGRPHRRIGCCIDSNPIILFPTNQASNDLITAMVAISTARRPSFKLDVPDLPDFQSLFSCHRSPYLPQVALPDLPFMWALHVSAPYL